MKTRIFSILSLLLLFVFATSCEKEDLGGLFGVNCEGDECLDLEKMAQLVEQKLDGKVVKYGYRIRSGFAAFEGASGPKRTSTNPPASNFTVNDRFNPASVSKVVTATAILRSLEQKNISINTSIAGFLPSSWNVPSSVQGITFKEVLAHTSGFRSSSNYEYNGMKGMVEAGISLSDKVYSYNNRNYALCRILLPGIHNYQPVSFGAPGVFYSAYFINYVEEMLDAVGISGVNWTPETNGTLFYPYPAGNKNGTNYGDWALKAGSAGVQMSVRELSEFLMRLHINGHLISTAMQQDMKTHQMGWFAISGPKDGTAYGHGGFFPGGPHPNGGLWNGGSELHSAIIRFDSGVEAVLVVNGTISAQQTLVDAYNEAWKTN
jgi:CubicO group peptidase (beta-lactamase class C family)